MSRSIQNILGLSLKDTVIVILNNVAQKSQQLKNVFVESDFSSLREEVDNNNIELMEQIVALFNKASNDVDAALDGKKFDHISNQTLKILRELYFYVVLSIADNYDIAVASGYTKDLERGFIGINDFLIDNKKL